MGHDLPAEVEASPERISKGQSEQRKLQALMPWNCGVERKAFGRLSN